MIAERVLDLYYPQARPFSVGNGDVVNLRQIGMKSSEVLRAVETLRAAAAEKKCHSLHEVRQRLRDRYESTLDAVENTFVRYPIPLLQVVGNRTVPFLYEVGWAEGTSVQTLRAKDRDHLLLLDGVADRLVVLGPMLRPLIEMHWTRDVMRWTKIDAEDEHIRSHLFGRERVAFPKSLVHDLADLQDGTCFYCGDSLTRAAQVDHFIPWSRYANNATENLVLADRCNNHKSDYLAATQHLARWRVRLASAADELVDIARRSGWPTDAQRTWSIARTAYTHLTAGTPLWQRGKQFELASAPWDHSE